MVMKYLIAVLIITIFLVVNAEKGHSGRRNQLSFSLKSNGLSMNIPINPNYSKRDKGIPTFQLMKDEVVDMWDSLVFAETNEQRLRTASTIMRRCEPILKVAGGVMIAGALTKILMDKR
jgi:hypothetical protein